MIFPLFSYMRFVLSVETQFFSMQVVSILCFFLFFFFGCMYFVLDFDGIT
uniref:Uncharacterized protein n=1 Tax=Rhizophora mucronata TaxID=61149 RepID=A0A2P2QID2_RHIMU